MTVFPSEAELRGLLVGPESVTWRYASDARLYSVMLYPLLLQVAHPVVGAGVRDYSDFEHRPWNRLLRTIDYATVLVYGGDDAAAMGRKLRGLHRGFRGVREDGTPYYALESEAYAWVHATLLESYVAGHAQFGRPLTPAQRGQFYLEYKRLGRLIGVGERDLPPTWTEFTGYFNEMCEQQLVRTVSVDRVLAAATGPVPPPLPVLPGPLWRGMAIPARRALWLGGIGLLTPSLRERFGLTWTTTDEKQFRTLGRASRALTPILPKPLQIVGPAQLRVRRKAIARGPLGQSADQHDARAAARASAIAAA
jgi:uncharacterized protein (DUF2236 family)